MKKTFARHVATSVDFVALNKAAITQVVPSDHEQALVLDASFVPKSGKHTHGLARFWNGTHSRTEPGLEISARGWRDVTDNSAYALSIEQTPPPGPAPDQELTRIDSYLDQVTRVVQQHALSPLCYVVTDGDDNKQKFLAGVQSAHGVAMPTSATSMMVRPVSVPAARSSMTAKCSGRIYRALYR